MRHGKKVNHLGRKTAHRKALMKNMSNSLIMHKRIKTTLAKAKALRTHVEPIITKSKNDTTHSRRTVFSYLQDKNAVTELFNVIAEKVAGRPGGYTRIIKLGFRQGDAAEMALIELVDFNDVYTNEKPVAKTKTRRSRRGKGGEGDSKDSSKNESAKKETPKAEKVEKAAKKDDTSKVTADKKATKTTKKTAKTTEGDKLTVVEGIGPAIEKILKAKGITTYKELADANVEDIKAHLTEAGSKFQMHDPTTWPEQSALLRDGKMDEFKKLTDELDGGRRV